MTELLFMMVVLIFFIVALGMPVVHSMGITSLFTLIFLRGIGAVSYDMIAQRIIYGLNNYVLVAIPLFLIVGRLANDLGITERIFNLAKAIVGRLPGGLAIVNVVASIIFAGMSGSAVADAGGLGLIEIKGMEEGGYKLGYAIAITAASSVIGPIIPPSIPMVIYGPLASVSVPRLLIAGFIPGLIMGLFLILFTVYLAHFRPSIMYVDDELQQHVEFSRSEIITSIKDGLLPLITPVILVGGIVSGVFTPTEASAIAVIWVLVLGTVYRTITLSRIVAVFKDVAIDTSIILYILAFCSVYSWIIARYQLAQSLVEAATLYISSPIILLFAINLVLLIVGCFIDPSPAIFIFTPLLIPLITQYGIDPIHFGIIMVVNLMLGVITPPVGVVLFTLQRVTGASLEEVLRELWLYYIPLVASLVLITCSPSLVLWLPNLILG